MMIARAYPTALDQSDMLILGLSRVNIQRLLNGEPIVVHRLTHGEGVPDGWRIVIMFGETELDMQKNLVALGMVDSGTKTFIDPRLK